MTIKYADRCLETSTTQGTGTINLIGPKTGYQSIVDGVGSGSVVQYHMTDNLNWETGIGTITAGTPDTLTRDVIVDSSNGGAAVNWGAGTRDVFIAASSTFLMWRDENLNDTNAVAVSTSGTGDAQIATPFPAPLAFSDRMKIVWRSVGDNTGPVTIEWGGLGAKPYVNNDGTDFVSGVIKEDALQEAVYNLAEDRFERTSPIYPAAPSADQVTVDDTDFDNLTGTDVQEVLEDIDGLIESGTNIGDLVRVADVGGSVAGLPAIDGSLLTGIATAEWELVDTVVISSPVSAVTLTDLDEWRDIMVMQVDITTSSNGERRMRVSANNGSSFLTEFVPTDNATRQEWNVTSSGTGSTAARSGGTIIYNFNTTDPVKPVVPLGRAGTTSVAIAVATASVLNCVQVANSAGNLTGGTIYVLGRK